MKIFNRDIKDFTKKKYRFLSNFWEIPIIVNGICFGSTEAYYQSQKDPSRVKEFEFLKPYAAKKLGRQVTPTEDWESRKIIVMSNALILKFMDPKLKKKLLKTGHRELIEGNYWHDNFWGNCTCEMCKDIEGQNWLGKLLMNLREILRNG